MPFRYGEEMGVWHVGKPYLAFEQRARGGSTARCCVMTLR
jgi:hypothetical protein